MSYPPNYDGYPPYGSQQPPFPGSQPGIGFTPYPTDGARGMPQANFGNNSNMPGFNLPQQQQSGYLPPGMSGGGGAEYPGGGSQYQNYNSSESNPPYNSFPPTHGQQSHFPSSGGSHGSQQRPTQSYQPFTGNSMTSPDSYGHTSNNTASQTAFNSFQPQQQQQQQSGQHYPNLPSSSSYSNNSSSNYGTAAASMMEPTIHPSPNFNAQNDAELVHKAMKGFGTDEKGLVKVLCHRTGQERAMIAKTYKQMYGKELVEALRGECSGKFEGLMVALATPPELYDAESIYRAIQGIGTDEDSLVEILCTRSNSEIAAMKAAYTYRKFATSYLEETIRFRNYSPYLPHTVYKRNMEHDIKGDTSGHFERLLVSLLNGARDESQNVDRSRAAQTAQELYKRGEKMMGTDESYFNSVLAAQSLPQLRAVFEEYRRVSGKDLDKSIESEMSGDLRKGMVSLVKCIQNPAVFFAEQLYKSMKGMGTNDHILVRVLVTRSDKDLGAIKREFHRLFKQPLENMIKGDTSGDYESGLVALCGGGR